MYDQEKQELKPFVKGNITKFKHAIKKLIGIPVYDGINISNFIKDYISQNIIIEAGTDGIIHTIKMQTEYPELTKKILLRIHEVSDLIVKNRNILRTSKYQKFIKKIKKAI